MACVEMKHTFNNIIKESQQELEFAKGGNNCKLIQNP